MPNYYSGITTIYGNIDIFRKWYLNNLITNKKSKFAQNFAPLSSGEYDFSTACDEWGVKWDFDINVISGLDEDDDTFIFTFDSAWNSPCYLWKKLELLYDVTIEEHGYEEGNRFFYKYYNGKHIVKNIDIYDKWYFDQLNFIPSKEALNDDDIYNDELTELSYDNNHDIFEKWHSNILENDIEWKDVNILGNL